MKTATSSRTNDLVMMDANSLAGVIHTQVFPFDVERHWPRAIGDRTMQTYHEWMKANLLITMSGCPALAAPAGFGDQGLPIGIQLIGPNRSELDCLRLAFAYETAMDRAWLRLPDPRAPIAAASVPCK